MLGVTPESALTLRSLRRNSQAWSLLIVFAATLCVASADYLVKSVSLGYLYILPVSLSAIVLSRRPTVAVVTLCVFFHDLFGPPYPTIQARILHNLTALAAFIFAVVLLQRFVAQRNALFDYVTRQRDELLKELALAAQVQQLFLPMSDPDVSGFDISSAMHPAGGVGGDYYDYIPLPNGSMDLVIADVGGKGVAAALLMSATAAAIQLEASEPRRLSDLVSRLNRELYSFQTESRFVTLLVGELDPRSRTLKCVNCGHDPALLLRAAGDQETWLAASCVPLGLFPTVNCHPEEVTLEPGDVLVFYTDGLTEAENTQGQEFGRDGIVETVRQNRNVSARELVNNLYGAVRAFTLRDTFADDLTIMVIKVDPLNTSV